MSDVEQSRDESTGQFAQSTDGLYGLAREEAEAGYKPMFPAKKDEELTVAEATEQLTAQTGVEPEPEQIVIYDKETGQPINDNLSEGPVESLTVEQAAQLLTNYHDNKAAFDAKSVSDDFAAEVDRMRADALKDNPKLAEHFGIEPPADGADPKKTVDATNTKKSGDQAAEAAPIDGLDPEVERALKHPQVRQAIEEELGKAQHVQRSFSEALGTVQSWAQASFLEAVPELQGLAPEQLEQGLALLAQVDPPRFEKAMGLLGRVNQIQTAQHQQQQQRDYATHQQFETQRRQYSKDADQALGPMTAAEKTELVEELVSYVGEFGITREQLASEAQTNLAIHHPAFQKMAADALKYQRLMKAAKVVPHKAIPRVQRPGTSQSHGSSQNARLAALEAKFARTGSLQDAQALYAMQSQTR